MAETEEIVASEENPDHVEFGSPEAQEKFNRVYGDMKRARNDLRQHESSLSVIGQQNAKLLEEIESLKRSTADNEVSSTVTDLKKQEAEALESGEFEKAVSLRDQITDLKVKTNAPVPKKEPAPVPQASEPDQQALSAFLDERNEDGTLKRPWIEPGHPDHKTALRSAQVILGDPDLDIGEALQEIDKVNKRVMKQAAAGVLPGNSDVRPGPSKSAGLSTDEKLIAGAMYPNLSAKDREKRYADAKTKHL